MNIKNIFSRISIPQKKEIVTAVKSFSKQRKIVFLCFACLCFVSGIALFAQVAIQPFQEEIPVEGGTHKEGIIGTPRFVNPVLSFTNADKDVESLVFSGLTRKTIDGSIILDLAEDFSVSSDNLVYTFTIDENARFHDGKPVTAEDVVFTIQKIQNPEIKSPKQVLWEGVKVEVVDTKRVRFVLKQPFIGFLENTTIGILPKHKWEDVAVDEFTFSPLNTEPIGAGKYKIQNVKRTKGSVDTYVLKQSRYYHGEKPLIRKIHLYFFEDDTEAIRALKNNQVDAVAGLGPDSVDSLPPNTAIYTATLHRMFGLFFHQKENSPIQEKAVRQAIDLALDRNQIIQKVFQGFGEPIKSPLPTNIQTNNNYKNLIESDIQTAEALLTAAGWTQTSGGTRHKNGKPLTVTLTTADIPELKEVSTIIQQQLREIGIEITIQTLSVDDLNQNVIRPRNFEILLFGHMLNQESDVFAFWHSSQTRDPGLNISSYKNQTVDKVLEKIIRTFDTEERAKLYSQFESEFFKDLPATFIYSPELIYAVHGKVGNIILSPITNSSQRLLDMETWYKETNYVIPIKD